jgi:hypothetical protein
MSTIYTFHRELGTATPVAGDRILTSDISTDTGHGATSKDATLTVWGAAARGKATTDLLGFYGATPIAQQTFTATCITALTTNPTFSATTGAGVYGFASSTAAAAYCKRVQQMQVDLEILMGAVNSTALVSVTGL